MGKTKWCCEHRPTEHNEQGCLAFGCLCKSPFGKNAPVDFSEKCKRVNEVLMDFSSSPNQAIQILLSLAVNLLKDSSQREFKVGQIIEGKEHVYKVKFLQEKNKTHG